MLWLMTLCIMAVMRETTAVTYYGGKPSGFMQVIRRLGVNRSGAVKVSQGRSRTGESPIYFIKLPPTPYFYQMQNAVTSFENSDHKVPVDFTNNGRPNQVYHWNLPEINSHLVQLPYTSSGPSALTPPASVPGTLYMAPSISVPAAATPGLLPAGHTGLLPGVPSAKVHHALVPPSYESSRSPVSTAQPSGAPSVKTWISDKKQYSYNGRPSGIYIYKSKRPIRPITVPKNGRRPTKKGAQRN